MHNRNVFVDDQDAHDHVIWKNFPSVRTTDRRLTSSTMEKRASKPKMKRKRKQQKSNNAKTCIPSKRWTASPSHFWFAISMTFVVVFVVVFVVFRSSSVIFHARPGSIDLAVESFSKSNVYYSSVGYLFRTTTTPTACRRRPQAEWRNIAGCCHSISYRLINRKRFSQLQMIFTMMPSSHKKKTRDNCMERPTRESVVCLPVFCQCTNYCHRRVDNVDAMLSKNENIINLGGLLTFLHIRAGGFSVSRNLDASAACCFFAETSGDFRGADREMLQLGSWRNLSVLVDDYH